MFIEICGRIINVDEIKEMVSIKGSNQWGVYLKNGNVCFINELHYQEIKRKLLGQNISITEPSLRYTENEMEQAKLYYGERFTQLQKIEAVLQNLIDK